MRTSSGSAVSTPFARGRSVRAAARAPDGDDQRREQRASCGETVDAFALDQWRAEGQARLRMPEFTHLHLHTQYSLLDGAIRLDQLFPEGARTRDEVRGDDRPRQPVRRARFLSARQGHGVKPIFGCETYIAPDRLDKTERRSNHLILLAKNEVGWKNLSYLNSMGYLEGFYYNPRIDKPLLAPTARA
jgi:DNA polymerase III alpha subunit (gram-positive type)